MKRIILLLLLLPACAWGAPAIVFETESHDFGTVGPAANLAFTFAFTNGGTDELVIGRVSPFS